jgi:8-oxo-dGTP pyrophosphatase MutT (NUDIX family)
MTAVPADPLATVVEYLVRRLTEPLPGPAAQRRFAPLPMLEGWQPDDEPPSARAAAALILIYPGADGPTVALTERHTHLPHHPGQISLPGGAIDPGEQPAAAALRETEEEIGVPRRDVQLVGALSRLWIPQSNFVLRPFVGVTSELPRFEPHPHEVADIIPAPLAILRDRQRTRWTRRERPGRTIDFPYFDVNGRIIWGATAMVLSEFVCLWDPEHAPIEPQPYAG